MSFIIKTVSRSSPQWTISRALAFSATRPFHSTSFRAALSESDQSPHDAEDHKRTIDHHKEEHLKKQKEGRGQWTKELASNSEAAIKADRNETTGSVEDDIENLQKEASEHARVEEQKNESK